MMYLRILNFKYSILQDQDASLSAFLGNAHVYIYTLLYYMHTFPAYLESPKKKSASNNLPDLVSHDYSCYHIQNHAVLF